MLFKFPKDDKNFAWTQHVKNKMLRYRLSEQKIKTVLKNPARKEEGIAPKTTAVMKRNDTPKRKEELWVMFQETRNEKTFFVAKQQHRSQKDENCWFCQL